MEYNIPFLNFKDKTVGYWEDANWQMDFTMMNDTAAYTAHAALDYLVLEAPHIASFQASPRGLADFTKNILNDPFELVRICSLEDLQAKNRADREADPSGESKLYAKWQQGQYLQSILSTQHPTLDNGRYPDLKGTKLDDFIPSKDKKSVRNTCATRTKQKKKGQNYF